MLAPTSERIEDALERLSPDDRALLELSLRRGVADDDIAALLHVHREHVEHRREQALERLSEDLGESRAEIAALVGQSLRGNGRAAAEVTPTPSPTPGRRVTDYPPSSEARRRARRRAWLIAGAALTAGGVALVLALSSGGGNEPSLGPEAGQPKAAPAPTAAAHPVALAPVTANGASGSAQLRGSQLRLRVSGLPAGSYSVWLFDDVSDARQVAHFKGVGAVVSASLPKGFGHYSSIDVSREPADGNANHSGDSVLRAPLAKLTR